MQHSVNVIILQHVGGNDDECGLLPLGPWWCLSRQSVYGTVCSGARVRIALIDRERTLSCLQGGKRRTASCWNGSSLREISGRIFAG